MSERPAKKKPSVAATLGRVVPSLGLLLLAGALGAGWYRSHETEEFQRLEMSQRLASTEKELAEIKGDLEHCKAWMDTRLLMAQAQDAVPDASEPEVLAAPTASVTTVVTAPASAVGVAQGVAGERSKTRLLLRRRRMLQLRGQANNDPDLMDQAEAGPSP